MWKPSCPFLHTLQRFKEHIKEYPTFSVAGIFKKTYKDVDSLLEELSKDDERKSGCTAVTAFLQIEDPDGGQASLKSGNPDATIAPPLEHTTTPSPVSIISEILDFDSNGTAEDCGSGNSPDEKKKGTDRLGSTKPSTISDHPLVSNATVSLDVVMPIASNLRRVLYCANAGDSRAVLCKDGKAERLTYDHKGSDKAEAKRIRDTQGGYVLFERALGILAVTRSLGDSDMKKWVIGKPYTQRTELSDKDELVILASDGVSYIPAHNTRFCRH